MIADDGHIKVTDFGTAKVLSSSSIELPPRPTKNTGRGRGPSTTSGGRTSVGRKSFVGTADYVSPEVLTDKTAGPPSDIWALGAILYQMLCGKTPFHGKSEYLVFQAILKREITFPDDFDPLARDLVEKLLVLEPADRLGAGEKGISELKSHPFFQGIDFRALPKTAVPDIPPPHTLEDQHDGDELPSGTVPYEISRLFFCIFALWQRNIFFACWPPLCSLPSRSFYVCILVLQELFF